MPATPPSAVHLADPAQARDLATLLARARRIDADAAVRLQARGPVLAAWVPVMASGTLLDELPTVIGMRAVHLSAPAHADVTVPAASVLERLARLDRQTTDRKAPGGAEPIRLALPPVTLAPAWAGSMPGASGWLPEGQVPTARLGEIAREGVAEVEAALPQSPGQAITNSIRAKVWGRMLPEGIPAGAAFGAEALGFLANGGNGSNGSGGPSGSGGAVGSGGSAEMTTLFTQGPWVRLSNARGHVIARAGASLR